MPKKYFWLKMPDDYFQSKEIKKLRQVAGGDTFVIIYLKLQLLSIKNQGVLSFEGIGDDFIDEMALVIDEKSENVGVTLNFLEKYGLIKETNTNEFTLEGTLKMIGSEHESTERVRKFREKQKTNSLSDNKIDDENEKKTLHVTKCNDIKRREEKRREENIRIDKENIRIDKDCEIDKKKLHGIPDGNQSASRQNTEKINIREYVVMTQTEIDKLKSRYDKAILKDYVDRLNNYIGSKGKKYKSHYHTLLVWLKKDGVKELPQDLKCPTCSSIIPKHRYCDKCGMYV